MELKNGLTKENERIVALNVLKVIKKEFDDFNIIWKLNTSALVDHTLNGKEGKKHFTSLVKSLNAEISLVIIKRINDLEKEKDYTNRSMIACSDMKQIKIYQNISETNNELIPFLKSFVSNGKKMNTYECEDFIKWIIDIFEQHYVGVWKKDFDNLEIQDLIHYRVFKEKVSKFKSYKGKQRKEKNGNKRLHTIA